MTNHSASTRHLDRYVTLPAIIPGLDCAQINTVADMTLFCGLTIIDLVHEVSELPGHGTKAVTQRASIDAGGPATNAARTAATLSHQVMLTSLIGTWLLALLARQILEQEGIILADLADSGPRRLCGRCDARW